MSATVKIYSYLAVDLGGELLEIGSRETAEEIDIAGSKYEVITTVADNYGRELLWQNGDGNVDDFDVLVVESTEDVLLELTIDRAGTPAYATLGVLADVPMILTSDDLIDAITTNESETTVDQIDQIAVQNNQADGEGDATVRLTLLT